LRPAASPKLARYQTGEDHRDALGERGEKSQPDERWSEKRQCDAGRRKP
jgi:hypothetical protein